MFWNVFPASNNENYTKISSIVAKYARILIAVKLKSGERDYAA